MIHPYLTHFLALKRSGLLEGAHAEWADVRSSAIYAFSYSIPSFEVLDELANLGPVVEMGAGSGYWAWMLSQQGVMIECFDSESHLQSPKWFDVKKGDPTDLSRFKNSTLLMVWPPSDSTFSESCLDHYPGQNLVYVGNLSDTGPESNALPKTATPAFHKRLLENFRLVKTIELPHWPGFKDHAYFFRRE